MSSQNKAFTLVELLITLSIIALLIAATAVSLITAQKSSRDSKRLGDLLAISKGIDEYASTQRGRYPSVSGYTGCASALSSSISSYLSTSVVPSEVNPLAPAGSCADYRNGYTYYQNQPGSGANLADNLGVFYVLSTGLERNLSADQSDFKTASALGITLPASSRTPVLLVGAACGSTCP